MSYDAGRRFARVTLVRLGTRDRRVCVDHSDAQCTSRSRTACPITFAPGWGHEHTVRACPQPKAIHSSHSAWTGGTLCEVKSAHGAREAARNCVCATPYVMRGTLKWGPTHTTLLAPAWVSWPWILQRPGSVDVNPCCIHTMRFSEDTLEHITPESQPSRSPRAMPRSRPAPVRAERP